MKKREEKISLKFWSPLRPVGQAILVSVNLVCSSKYIYGSDETVQIRKMVWAFAGLQSREQALEYRIVVRVVSHLSFSMCQDFDRAYRNLIFHVT